MGRMSKTLKDDKYKKFKIEKRMCRDKNLRVQREMEAQEQEILQRFGIRGNK
jgi:hypothetical protein